MRARTNAVSGPRLGMAVAAALLLTGCGSVRINTVPQGAQIYRDGELAGTSPCSVSAGGPFTSSFVVKAVKSGYDDVSGYVQKEYDVWKGDYWPTEKTFVMTEAGGSGGAAPAEAAPAASAQPAQPGSATATSSTRACVSCKVAIGAQKFCPDCGAKQPEEPKAKFCASCGGEQKPGAKFCQGCGEKQ